MLYITSTHLVSVAEVAAALLLTASEYWLWEVEVDALLHLEGTAVVQAGQEASLEVVQDQHVARIIKQQGRVLLLYTCSCCMCAVRVAS